MKIYNGTPHTIHIVEGSTFVSAMRKYTGGNFVFSIPSDGMLNATIDTEEDGFINGVIPVYKKKTIGHDPLPKGYDIYIVSVLFATAYDGEDADKLYVVADPVMSADGKTFMGCRGIQKWNNN